MTMQVPLTVILLGYQPAERVTVTALSARKGLKTGYRYVIVAVSWKGQVYVAPDNAPDEPIDHWYPMETFAMAPHSEAANDN